MKYSISYEAGYSIDDITRKFRAYLSPRQIQLTTARAINITATRAIGFIKRDLKTDYTLNSKYYSRFSYIAHRASGRHNQMYSAVNFSYKPIPFIGFKHTGAENKRSLIAVEIKKGNTETFRHAFIRTVKSGHTGIFTRGRYIKGQGIIYTKGEKSKDTGKEIITEMRSASFIGMITTKEREERVNKFVNSSLPPRLKVLLNQKINKMAK